MSGGGGDGGGQFTVNPWPGAGMGGGTAEPDGSAGAGQGIPRQEGCEELAFEARLRAVDPDELAHLKVGDITTVVFDPTPTPHIGVFRRLSSGGLAPTPAGALVERLAQLLPCLAMMEFEAELLEIDGGNTRVQVRRAT